MKNMNLPVHAYYCPDWFEQEQAKIFEQSWQFAGFVEDVLEPGDFITVQVGRSNLVVVRGQDQRLRCFHNMCRHRGTQLLRSTGKAQKALTCPYHDWTYALSGELISVPEEKTQFPMLQKDKLCLHRGSVETWCGMVFVHVQPEPKASFADYFDGVEEKLGPHRPEELVEFAEARTDHVIAANWKIVAENYIDVYHLAHLHSATLNMYDHAKAKFEFVGPHYMFYEPFSTDYAKAMPGAAPMPIIDHIPKDKLGAYVPLLFPNLGLAETESSWSIFHIIPLGPESTRVITRSKVMNKSSWSFALQAARSGLGYFYKQTGAKYEDSKVQDDPLRSGDFMAEDIYACEQQQKSLHSPLFSVGASAEHTESSVRQFQAIIAQWMQASKADA